MVGGSFTRFTPMSANSTMTVRLLIAGCASWLLLCWIEFVPGAMPGIIPNPSHSPNTTRILVSASLSVLAIVPLVIVLFRGSAMQRMVSALALICPTLVCLWIIREGLGR